MRWRAAFGNADLTATSPLSAVLRSGLCSATMNFFPPQPPFMLSIPDMRVAAAAFQAVHDAQARAREANPRPPGVMRIITPDALINAAANDDVITARCARLWRFLGSELTRAAAFSWSTART